MSMWFGRMMGATLGLFTGGPFGALVGFITGSLLDDAFAKKIQSDLGSIQNQGQQIFYRALFRSMGRLAKADGRVSEQEIQAASLVMDRMGLKGAQRQAAIDYFSQGKDTDTLIEKDLSQLRMLLSTNPNLALMFLEIQIGVAYADGQMTMPEQQTLLWLCQHLGISREQFDWLHSSIVGGQQGAYRHGGGWQQAGRSASSSELAEAYRTLGVSADTPAADLKKAYRKLMSQHHPDKLMASGVSERELQRAKERTQQIQTAYDLVSKQRK